MGPIEFASANWAPIEWRNIKDAEEEVLAERLSGWRERYPDVPVHKIVVCDRPGLRLLGAERAHLVVLGSHGRGGFAGMLLGSVCSAVVHNAGVPVIIARPPRTGLTPPHYRRVFAARTWRRSMRKADDGGVGSPADVGLTLSVPRRCWLSEAPMRCPSSGLCVVSAGGRVVGAGAVDAGGHRPSGGGVGQMA